MVGSAFYFIFFFKDCLDLQFADSWLFIYPVKKFHQILYRLLIPIHGYIHIVGYLFPMRQIPEEDYASGIYIFISSENIDIFFKYLDVWGFIHFFRLSCFHSLKAYCRVNVGMSIFILFRFAKWFTPLLFFYLSHKRMLLIQYVSLFINASLDILFLLDRKSMQKDQARCKSDELSFHYVLLIYLTSFAHIHVTHFGSNEWIASNLESVLSCIWRGDHV